MYMGPRDYTVFVEYTCVPGEYVSLNNEFSFSV